MKIFSGCLLEISSEASGFYLGSKINSALKIKNIYIEEGYYLVTHFIQNDSGNHLIEILYNNNLIMIKFNEQNCRIIDN